MGYYATAMPGAFLLPPDELAASTSSYTSTASPKIPILPSPQFQSAFGSNSSTANGSRKRARLATPRRDSGISTPRDPLYSYGESDHVLPSSAPSPAPFAHEKYFLAGGLDTPLAARSVVLERQNEAEAGWERKSRRYGIQPESESYFPETPYRLSGQLNGLKRKYSDSSKTGWGKTMASLVGGMINFCWSKTFRGFVAGGGEGYGVNGCVLSPVEQTSWTDVSPSQDVFSSHYNVSAHDQSSAPGHFPEENFIQDYMSNPEHFHARELSTPTKYDTNGDREFKKWVFVGNGDYGEGETSPNQSSRKVPRSTASQPKPISRASFAGRPKLVPHRPSLPAAPAFNVERSASYASPRGSPKGSKSNSSTRHNSNASPNTPRKSASRASLATPASPDVIKFEKKIKMRDSMENAKINRANRQLQDMIKQGREALGTKVEVMDASDMEDEGYVEGTADRDERW